MAIVIGREAIGHGPTTTTIGSPNGGTTVTYIEGMVTASSFSGSLPMTGAANYGTVAPPALTGTGSFMEGTWAELNFDSDYSASVAAGQIIKLTVSASVLPSFDQDAVRGFVAEYSSGSNAVFNASNLLSAFTTYNYTAGLISFYYTASSTATLGELNNGKATVYYQKVHLTPL